MLRKISEKYATICKRSPKQQFNLKLGMPQPFPTPPNPLTIHLNTLSWIGKDRIAPPTGHQCITATRRGGDLLS